MIDARTIRLAALTAMAALLPCGCGGSPVPIPPDPIAALDLAESLLEEGRPEIAHGLLEAIERERYTEDDRARLDLLRMRALFALGDYWDAFEVARDFVEEHRFSEFATGIEQLEFAAGKALIDDGDSDGEAVLQHFVERFATSPHAAEALKLLGEWSYQRERYPLAEVRFTELLQSHPTSEWAEFAHYRLALTAFRRVTGWEYDLDQMTLAHNELSHYLSTAPERPEFRTEAERALATLDEWMARRHLWIAGFYRRIGNLPGERLHLGIAAREFPGTEHAQKAGKRLAALPEGGGPQ